MDRLALSLMSVLAVLYFLLFAALGAEIPFVPQVLASAGMTAGQLGIVLAIGTTIQVVVAPILGRAADRLGVRPVLFTAAFAAAATLLFLFFTRDNLWAAFLMYVLFAAATAPLNPLADAIAVPACDRSGVPYGRVRGVGSAGFFAGILLSSKIGSWAGAQSVLVTSAALFAMLTATLPFVQSEPVRSSQDRSSGDIRTLLRIPAFRRVLLVAALVIGSHAMSDAFAVIHWRASGIAADTIGVMLAVAVVSEFLVFSFLGPMLLGRFGPSVCAAIGAAVGVARWAVFAESQSVWPVLLAQLMHGLTFSLVHLACMQVLSSSVPRQFFATAQSLYGVCSNAVASAAIMVVAGALFGALHAHAFWLASILCAIALPFALRLSADVRSDAG